MNYQAQPATRGDSPLLLGIVGPPGGGKTLSALRLARGIQSIRGGDIHLIDTEGGRSRAYNDQVPFNIVEMPNGRSNDFQDAIEAQLPARPAAIIVDSMSDEHEAYLEWHDEMVPAMGGNDWAAWSKPKAARKKLISRILKIKTPLIFTFRAREKTKQNPDPKAKRNEKIINIGWQPVAPLEIVHTLNMTCILPPRADGVPVWQSDKIGEDFIIKLPNYLAPYITQGQPLDEQMGAAFARWARGDSVSSRHGSEATEATAPATTNGASPGAGAVVLDDDGPTLAECDIALDEAAKKGSAALAQQWADTPREHKATLKAALDRRHKATAAEADAAIIGN